MSNRIAVNSRDCQNNVTRMPNKMTVNSRRSKEYQRKVIVISSHPDANQYLPADAIVYPIKDPKKEKQHRRGEWNARCENLLSSILETYRPANALFDGPFPYRGVVNIAEYYPKQIIYQLV